MRKTALALCFVNLIALLTNTASAQTVWNAVSDFSNSNGNPNGAWSYGWVNNSVFTLYDSTTASDTSLGTNSPGWFGDVGGDGTPCVWKNGNSYEVYGIQPGEVCLHPGPSGQASIIRWTAPEGIVSPVNVQGQFLPGYPAPMQVGIFINGIPQVAEPYWQSTDYGTFEFSMPVSTGDTIDFAVYGAYYGGSTPLEATITAVPEPSSFILLASSAIGLISLYYRRYTSMTK